MAITPFKAMEFKKNDVITRGDLDTMQNNLQYINDHTPRGRFFRPNGTMLDAYTVIVAGRAKIRKNKKSDDALVKVRFGAHMFHPACRPHITTAIITEQTPKVFCVVRGPEKGSSPNSTGFNIAVNIAAEKKKRDAILNPFYVSWHAYGYRPEGQRLTGE